MKELDKIKITLNGVEYVATLGLGFLGSFLKDENLKMNQFDEAVASNPIEYLPKIIYHAIKFNSFLEGTPEPTLKDVIVNFHKEGFSSPEISKFQKALENSMIIDIPQAQGKQKAKK